MPKFLQTVTGGRLLGRCFYQKGACSYRQRHWNLIKRSTPSGPVGLAGCPGPLMIERPRRTDASNHKYLPMRQKTREDVMADNSAPRQGDIYLKLDGVNNFVEIPSSADYGIATTGELSVAAWIRPDTLNFPRWERTGYVHWLGKGEGTGDAGQQEWVVRMYNRDHTTEHPPRPNRVSFYTFNPHA